MMRLLAVVTGATTFLLCLVAIREHAALVRAGYDVSAMERKRSKTVMNTAQAREKLSRLRTPAVLAERAAEQGFATEYPRQLPVVWIRTLKVQPKPVARNE